MVEYSMKGDKTAVLKELWISKVHYWHAE